MDGWKSLVGLALLGGCASAERAPVRADLPEVERTPVAASPTATWTVESDERLASFGWSVAGVGDVNGDGYDDVVAGAPEASASWGSGVVMAWFGSAAGLPTAPDWRESPTIAFQTEPNFTLFGYTVAGAGDVDGDGYADVMITGVDVSDYDEGGVAVYHGSPYGLLDVPNALITPYPWCSYCDRNWFGAAASSAGDLDGDGYDDIVVGAPEYSFSYGEGGSAFVWSGSADGVSGDDYYDLEDWMVGQTQLGASFGAAVAGAGDVNGDGFDDLLVGAPGYDDGETDEGRVYLYLGSATGPTKPAAWTAQGDQEGASFGAAVAGAGDVNGDGYDDVIVGAPGYDGEGAAFLFLGDAAGLEATAAWIGQEGQADSRYGAAVASAGDIDGDGYADLIVGADQYSDPETWEGAAFLYLGGSAGPGAAVWVAAPTDQEGARFGLAVASAGDVDGDGLGDLIVGAPNYTNGENGEGQASLFPGLDPLGPDGDGDGVPEAEDCDDADPDTWPGAEERCDGIDNDCAGGVPDDELDLDGDGVRACDGDCDDGDAAVGPEAEERCGDGRDDDCDGAVDEVDACPPAEEPEVAGGEGGEDGCGCDASRGAAPLGALLALVPLVLRRRRGR